MTDLLNLRVGTAVENERAAGTGWKCAVVVSIVLVGHDLVLGVVVGGDDLWTVKVFSERSRSIYNRRVS